jgi:hypothetical protein
MFHNPQCQQYPFGDKDPYGEVLYQADVRGEEEEEDGEEDFGYK